MKKIRGKYVQACIRMEVLEPHNSLRGSRDTRGISCIFSSKLLLAVVQT